MKILWRYTHTHTHKQVCISVTVSKAIIYHGHAKKAFKKTAHTTAWLGLSTAHIQQFFPQCLQISPLSKLLYSLHLITWTCQWYHFSFAPFPPSFSFFFSTSSFQIWSWILVNYTFFYQSVSFLCSPHILPPLCFFSSLSLSLAAPNPRSMTCMFIL